MEEWKNTIGFSKYEVSNLGKVRNAKTHQIKKISRYSLGYEYVKLMMDGESNVGNRKMKIHRLVAMAFIPNPDDKPQVNHKDGDKTNNRVENLEWCTASENQRHAVRSGLFRDGSGEKNSQCKLTEKLVMEIKCQLSLGKSQRVIADMFGISQSSVSLINLGKNWPHIK